jgi:quinol-cytochrome oxidoreductase complex cytochrome b subunit
MFMFQTLKKIPAKVWFADGDVLGVLAFGLAGVVWVLLPFFDQAAGKRGRRLVLGAGMFALSYIIAMTIYAYTAK